MELLTAAAGSICYRRAAMSSSADGDGDMAPPRNNWALSCACVELQPFSWLLIAQIVM
jgi:hypothetical protein